MKEKVTSELPKAKGRPGNSVIIVDDCPYCHERHYHGHGGIRPISISGSRVADCGGGQYELTS
jgi:hypothetical protein